MYSRFIFAMYPGRLVVFIWNVMTWINRAGTLQHLTDHFLMQSSVDRKGIHLVQWIATTLILYSAPIGECLLRSYGCEDDAGMCGSIRCVAPCYLICCRCLWMQQETRPSRVHCHARSAMPQVRSLFLWSRAGHAASCELACCQEVSSHCFRGRCLAPACFLCIE